MLSCHVNTHSGGCAFCDFLTPFILIQGLLFGRRFDEPFSLSTREKSDVSRLAAVCDLGAAGIRLCQILGMFLHGYRGLADARL